MQNFEKAIEAAQGVSAHEGQDHTIINHHPEFLDGSLYVVGFKDENDESKTVYVYIEGKKVTVCKNQALLNEMVARKTQKKGIAYIIESFGGVAGFIGLAITGTIIYMFFNDPKVEIPQILSGALTTILGYYFGTQTNK